MSSAVRLKNVNIEEFEEFYSRIRISARRMSRDQMLTIADLLHDMIREQRGVEHRGEFRHQPRPAQRSAGR
jgi:hypothetical protein